VLITPLGMVLVALMIPVSARLLMIAILQMAYFLDLVLIVMMIYALFFATAM
jgi:hypothetical protein